MYVCVCDNINYINETKIRVKCYKKEEYYARGKHPSFNDGKKRENVIVPIRLGRLSHSISSHSFFLSYCHVHRQVMKREKKKLLFIKYLKDAIDILI
jgi:hypothetical protein